MKLIYKASDINEANIVSGMLRSNGIEAYVGGYYLQGGVGHLAASDFANVHVADEHVDEAKHLIGKYENASKNSVTSEAKRSNSKFFIKVIIFILVFNAILYILLS